MPLQERMYAPDGASAKKSYHSLNFFFVVGIDSFHVVYMMKIPFIKRTTNFGNGFFD